MYFDMAIDYFMNVWPLITLFTLFYLCFRRLNKIVWEALPEEEHKKYVFLLFY